jgi:hypothetical protein
VKNVQKDAWLIMLCCTSERKRRKGRPNDEGKCGLKRTGIEVEIKNKKKSFNRELIY